MIYILSKEKSERSTEKVIDWLWYFGAEFQRINGSTYVNNLSQTISASEDLEKNVPTPEDVVWFRRWLDEGEVSRRLDDGDLSNYNLVNLYQYLFSEIKIVSDFFFRNFRNCKWLTYPHELKYNKLDVLDEARNCGLTIPATLITTSKKEVITFKQKYQRIINKIISHGPPRYQDDQHLIGLCTTEVMDDLLEQLPDHIFPSLFQELIEKEFEIRTFFLGDDFYSMAIFSQNDEQTQIDFRNYNRVKPNRMIPYKLPSNIEKKLHKLVTTLKLTTGSIDIIKSIDDYVFLEINPVGQFDMVSTPCNYGLDKKVAEYLIK